MGVRKGTGRPAPRAADRRWDEAPSALAALPRYFRSGVRSAHETVEYLRRRGVPLTQAARVVADYQRRGVVDDRACAQLWTDHWARRGYAWSAIRLKLSEKGLEAQAIEHAANRLGTASSDDARARLLVTRRRRSAEGRRQRSRLTRMLASRGFDQDLIERVLDESLGSGVAAEG